LLLAAARGALGDQHGEVEALTKAVRWEPDQPELWLHLADACGRARRFARAEAARECALSLVGAEHTPRGWDRSRQPQPVRALSGRTRPENSP
jgi:Flp pilus assembly protein TadD